MQKSKLKKEKRRKNNNNSKLVNDKLTSSMGKGEKKSKTLANK